MKGFTGIKDLDLKILMDVDDETLLNACSTNKELYRICNIDQSFWRNRYVKQYGENAALFKPKVRSWKNYYMQTIIDLQRFPNPIDFFTHIAWKNNVDKSYFFDFDKSELIPLKYAPGWVMNNLYLLNIPYVEVISFAPNALLLSSFNVYKNITPIELLQKVGRSDFFISDFISNGNKYVPVFSTYEQVQSVFDEDF